MQLTVRNVTLGYEQSVVSEKINFEMGQGDYLCVVGENGAGKSTLMKAILGLKPPISGTIVFGDGLKPNEIGYLPQQTTLQRDFPASVDEVVLSGCLNRCGLRPFYTKKERTIADQNMEKLGIVSLRRRSYRALSGGQQQRVLLARALCATRKLLILDEPVSGLDPSATADMYATIRNLNREGITILMISHDIAAAVREAKHILHLARHPLFFGTVADYQNSDVGRAFLRAEGSVRA